jgi:hypothetical protein
MTPILSLVPLFVSFKIGVIYFCSHIILQLLRAISIENEWIILTLSQWTGYNYLNSTLWLVIFVYILFTVMSMHIEKNLLRGIQKKEEKEEQLEQLRVLKNRIVDSLERENIIYQNEFDALHRLSSQAKRLIQEKSKESQIDFVDWNVLLAEMDTHMRKIDSLTKGDHNELL